MEEPSIAFLPVSDLHFPHNNREFYLSRELAGRGWKVYWLRPRSGTSRGVGVEWPVLTYPDLNVRGRKYLLPAYIASRLRLAGIRTLWLSGWTIRDLGELSLMTRTLKAAGIRVVYDPIDPICEFLAAQGAAETGSGNRCVERVQEIYRACALVVCVTPEIRDLLLSNGAPADRLVVGRWGTDGRLFDPEVARTDLKARLGLKPDTFLVGWLGTMEPFKGLREIVLPLIEAMQALEPSIHFVIAGRGTLEPEVRAWAEERPQLPLTVLPSIDYPEAPNFTGSLDAYLVATNPTTPFARSICPVKCFDALAMGTHLIVSRTPATEFLEAHKEVVSLAAFDRDSFLKALLDLYRSQTRKATKPKDLAVRAYTHQSVSVTLADAIVGSGRGS